MSEALRDGWWVLGAVVVVTAVVGLAKRWYDGRFRATAPTRPFPSEASRVPAGPGAEEPGLRLTAEELGAELGARATLLQFSSAFCAPCRVTRQVLARVAEHADGVRHVELDAEMNLDLVRRLDVRRTPTTLVLDAQGGVVARASGAPRPEQVVAALGRAGATGI